MALGVGPGDPELISVKGLRRLQEAPVVAFPAGLQGKPGVAQQIIGPWISDEQIQLPLEFPFVQDQTVFGASLGKGSSRGLAILRSEPGCSVCLRRGYQFL